MDSMYTRLKITSLSDTTLRYESPWFTQIALQDLKGEDVASQMTPWMNQNLKSIDGGRAYTMWIRNVHSHSLLRCNV